MDYSKKLTVLKHEYLENRRVLSDFQWGLSAIEIPDNITIKNNDVVVAVIDSGIDLNHNDLKNNIWTNPFEKADGIDILSKYRIKGWATDITNSNKRLLIQVTINDIHNYSRKANMLRSDIGGRFGFNIKFNSSSFVKGNNKVSIKIIDPISNKSLLVNRTIMV